LITEAQGPEKRELTREELQSVVFSVFALQDPKKRVRPLVGIDIETNTTSARTGRIIETGIVRYSSENETFEIVYDSLHGLPEVSLNGVGVGATNVHHITPDRIIGKSLFEEDAEEILSLLMDSTIVAHNAGFEDRFLSANLPGYIEAKAEGRITILDTRKVAKYLMPRSSDNTLQSFAEDNGIPYEGAHAAGQDALMMMRALMRLQKTIYSGGRIVTRRASASARMNAAQQAMESEAGR
jgi:DNA polymerase III epsilon subunit-like protein